MDAALAAARAYEELFVPALFQEWAPRVADAASVSSGDRVLDVACGTGALAREMLGRVNPNGTVTGLDPAPGMLAVARERSAAIEWHQGVAESLPFPDASFDAVVSQFGMMFFPDRAAAIREMLRVLTPGGRLAVAVWDSLENTPLYGSQVELLTRLAGAAAGDALRAPFCLGDTGQLTQLFSAAGVETLDVRRHPGSGLFPSLDMLVEADLRGWLPLMGVHLDEAKIEEVLAASRDLQSGYVLPDGRLRFESPAIIVSCRKPR
ncbi:MAG: methyltransferase domain-containing protein [Candidatus Eisenbacteria bacterium]